MNKIQEIIDKVTNQEMDYTEALKTINALTNISIDEREYVEKTVEKITDKQVLNKLEKELLRDATDIIYGLLTEMEDFDLDPDDAYDMVRERFSDLGGDYLDKMKPFF